MSEQEFDDARQQPDPAPTAETDDADPQASSYAPSQTEVNRGREQGLGVGQEDLNTQRDPTRGGA